MATLFGCKGCGQVAIEAVIELSGAKVEIDRFLWDDEAGWQRLAKFNPLRQAPTFVADDGSVITESVAILWWLAEQYPEHNLLPAIGSKARGDCLRWLLFIVSNVYAPIGVRDFPPRWVDGEAAQESLKIKTKERVEMAWRMMEDAIAPAPYLIGPTMGILDVYVAMVTRWTPGRSWFEANCPKMMSAVTRTEAHPAIAATWARNFALA